MSQPVHTLPVPRHGVVAVSTLLPAPRLPETVPMSAVQGTLALDLSGGATPLTHGPETASRPGLDAFAARFSAAVVEVIGGDRGVHQLIRWTSEQVYADLSRRVAALQGVTPGDRRVRRLRAQVRSVHLSCPSGDTAELAVHVRHGQRSRAIAARIERFEGRWQCTALEFG